MSKHHEKLVSLLNELFQLDEPDLDFGIYRIMRAKSAEVRQFLDKDLLPQIKEAFSVYRSADTAALEKELAELIAGVEKAGMDPEQAPRVQQLRERLTYDSVDVEALEADVYDHLYRFFRRYYHDGDFISKRVYKEGVYAIPYEGEEVKLHWVNYDQYYVKTSEYLRDYAFCLRPDEQGNPMRVHFRLVDAAEGTHNNVKESNQRAFVLTAEDFIKLEDGPDGKELIIRFEYRPATLEDWPENKRKGKDKPPTRKDLLDLAEERIRAVRDQAITPWIAELLTTHTKANGELADYSRLRAHLNRYTARNTFDYFIHKDLGGFLRRELDFYIKNEVMHLDDLENESTPRVEQYLSKVKVIQKIAHKIIDFVAHLEDFQKKLWLKKKFVTETSWCVRVGIIPEVFYPEICANEAQREEWVQLHAIEELIKQDKLSGPGASGRSESLTPAFLAAHPSLMIDTRHFSADFTARLLDSFGDIDEQTDGVLVHSENFQALNLIQKRFGEQVKCVYIDPPYNVEQDRQTGKFLYKDNYKHSTWLSMMYDRLAMDKPLLHPEAAHFISINETELHRLLSIVESFGRKYHGLFTWRRTRTGGHLSTTFNKLSDYVIVTTNPEGNRLYGGRADPEESQPLTKSTNKRRVLRFPPGSVEFLDTDAGRVEAGHQGTGDNPVKSVTPIEIIGGRNCDEIILEGPFVWTQATLNLELANGARIIVKKRHNLNPRFLRRSSSHKPFPSLGDNHFSVGTNEDGSECLRRLFGSESCFTYPKPVQLLERLAESKSFFDSNLTMLDYFAGSGTTGHAVVNLNREDGGRRKFILVEMGDYFDTVLLPRLKKITFTPEWKDGKPVRLATVAEAERSPRMFKVLRLESYEDTLNNLQLRRSPHQLDLFSHPEVRQPGGFYEQYILRYMLDVETRGSQSLLNIAAFTDPTQYQFKVKVPGSDESRLVYVDLIETFNWLIGLVVKRISVPRRFTVRFKRAADPDLPKDAPRRLVIDGVLQENPEGLWWFRTVEGETRDGRKTLVIWRNRPGGEDPEGVEQDNLVLNEWFQRHVYLGKDREFDLIYVNGTNNLENLKIPNDTWRARLIEEDFHRLMFAMEGD